MNELLVMIDAIANEKGLDKNDVVSILEKSHSEVFAKTQGVGNYISEVDIESGDFKTKRVLLVVENGVSEVAEGVIFNEELHIDEEDAGGLAIGESLNSVVNVNFGRMENNKLKQQIYYNLRMLSNEKKEAWFQKNKGTVVNGKVKMFRKGVAIIEVNEHECILPSKNGGANLTKGDIIRGEISIVELSKRGLKVVLDRTGTNLVKELFQMEVPEIHDGSIEIKAIGRVGGIKTKIVVEAKDTRVDAVGACIGMKGMRIRSVSDELNGEGIDVVEWKEDYSDYVQSLFSGCEFVSILIDEEDETIELILTDETVGLGIGKAGSTVNIASQILGMKVHVTSESDDAEQEKKRKANRVVELNKSIDLDDEYIKLLVDAGVKDIDDLYNFELSELDVSDEVLEIIDEAIGDAQMVDVVDKDEFIDRLIEVFGFDEEMAVELVDNNIKSMEDFADLSSDELGDIINCENCGELIIEARKICGWL